MILRKSLQKLFIILLFVTAGNAVHAQNQYKLAAGARQAGMAYTTVAIDGFWSSFHNQGILGLDRRLSFGINHESRFGLAELSNKTFGAIIPTGHGSIGALYSYYGYPEFNRHTAGLAYGLKLGNKIGAGVQADFYSTRQAGDYANTNELTFEAGIIYHPVNSIGIGLHLYNPLPDPIRNNNLPAVITLGTSFFISSSLMGSVELEGGSDGYRTVRAGAEFELLDNFMIRGGLMSEPLGASFGAGYNGRILKADIGFFSHENLGLTPSVSIILLLNR